MADHNNSIELSVFRPDVVDLQDAPWGQTLSDWDYNGIKIEELPKGISRHLVSFVNCNNEIFAVKEMAYGNARSEYSILENIERLRLPAVIPAGYIQLKQTVSGVSYLITRYLDRSIPYRNLFMRRTSVESRNKLLDAMASLLVQLHLSGVFWGDCSLSNTLFRHDAGAYQAYLVDAESVEIQTSLLSPHLRFLDLERMEANLTAEMLDLVSQGVNLDSITIYESGKILRQRYNNLLEIVTREEIIHPSENFRIQERIRSLNNLGFSVRDISFKTTDEGDQLRLRTIVADRSFHRDQVFTLTGIEAEENQARKLLNEIMEVRATQVREKNREIPIAAAAHHWQTHIFVPVLEKLQPILDERQEELLVAGREEIVDPIEVYCQVLEHKWYLSERANQDVGHKAAVENYIETILGQNLHNHVS
jgi:hypothetical protein